MGENWVWVSGWVVGVHICEGGRWYVKGVVGTYATRAHKQTLGAQSVYICTFCAFVHCLIDVCNATYGCSLPPPPQLQSILSAWRPLPAEEALELLDYAYQDPDVRAYAIRSLRQMS